jgi:hypothetical protein
MAEESLRESLDKAFTDNVDAPQAAIGAPEAPDAPSTPIGEPQAPVTAPTEAPGAPGTTETPVQAPPDKPAAPHVDVKPAQEPVQDVQSSTLPAPTTWKPEARELFKSLPAQVQQEVVRRERDVARFVQETAEIRQHFNSFIDTCRPYSQLIALDGGDPMKTFGEYLKTGAVLRLGTPYEKAQAIAQAVKQFDVNVNALDNALAQLYGGQPQQHPQMQPQQYKDPRLDELITQIQQTKAERDQELEQNQLREIETFRADPKNEFFNDLRSDIADLLEINARRGVRMTLPEAYERAAAMNPNISKVMQQRRLQEGAVRQKQLIDQKRRAVTGAPGAPLPQTNGSGGSLRDTLSAAFDAHQQPV